MPIKVHQLSAPFVYDGITYAYSAEGLIYADTPEVAYQAYLGFQKLPQETQGLIKYNIHDGLRLFAQGAPAQGVANWWVDPDLMLHKFLGNKLSSFCHQGECEGVRIWFSMGGKTPKSAFSILSHEFEHHRQAVHNFMLMRAQKIAPTYPAQTYQLLRQLGFSEERALIQAGISQIDSSASFCTTAINTENGRIADPFCLHHKRADGTRLPRSEFNKAWRQELLGYMREQDAQSYTEIAQRARPIELQHPAFLTLINPFGYFEATLSDSLVKAMGGSASFQLFSETTSPSLSQVRRLVVEPEGKILPKLIRAIHQRAQEAHLAGEVPNALSYTQIRKGISEAATVMRTELPAHFKQADTLWQGSAEVVAPRLKGVFEALEAGDQVVLDRLSPPRLGLKLQELAIKPPSTIPHGPPKPRLVPIYTQKPRGQNTIRASIAARCRQALPSFRKWGPRALHTLHGVGLAADVGLDYWSHRNLYSPDTTKPIWERRGHALAHATLHGGMKGLAAMQYYTAVCGATGGAGLPLILGAVAADLAPDLEAMVYQHGIFDSREALVEALSQNNIPRAQAENALLWHDAMSAAPMGGVAAQIQMAINLQKGLRLINLPMHAFARGYDAVLEEVYTNPQQPIGFVADETLSRARDSLDDSAVSVMQLSGPPALPEQALWSRQRDALTDNDASVMKMSQAIEQSFQEKEPVPVARGVVFSPEIAAGYAQLLVDAESPYFNPFLINALLNNDVEPRVSHTEESLSHPKANTARKHQYVPEKIDMCTFMGRPALNISFKQYDFTVYQGKRSKLVIAIPIPNEVILHMEFGLGAALGAAAMAVLLVLQHHKKQQLEKRIWQADCVMDDSKRDMRSVSFQHNKIMKAVDRGDYQEATVMIGNLEVHIRDRIEKEIKRAKREREKRNLSDFYNTHMSVVDGYEAALTQLADIRQSVLDLKVKERFFKTNRDASADDLIKLARGMLDESGAVKPADLVVFGALKEIMSARAFVLLEAGDVTAAERLQSALKDIKYNLYGTLQLPRFGAAVGHLDGSVLKALDVMQRYVDNINALESEGCNPAHAAQDLIDLIYCGHGGHQSILNVLKTAKDRRHGQKHTVSCGQHDARRERIIEFAEEINARFNPAAHMPQDTLTFSQDCHKKLNLSLPDSEGTNRRHAYALLRYKIAAVEQTMLSGQDTRDCVRDLAQYADELNIKFKDWQFVKFKMYLTGKYLTVSTDLKTSLREHVNLSTKHLDRNTKRDFVQIETRINTLNNGDPVENLCALREYCKEVVGNIKKRTHANGGNHQTYTKRSSNLEGFIILLEGLTSEPVFSAPVNNTPFIPLLAFDGAASTHAKEERNKVNEEILLINAGLAAGLDMTAKMQGLVNHINRSMYAIKGDKSVFEGLSETLSRRISEADKLPVRDLGIEGFDSVMLLIKQHGDQDADFWSAVFSDTPLSPEAASLKSNILKLGHEGQSLVKSFVFGVFVEEASALCVSGDLSLAKKRLASLRHISANHADRVTAILMLLEDLPVNDAAAYKQYVSNLKHTAADAPAQKYAAEFMLSVSEQVALNHMIAAEVADDTTVADSWAPVYNEAAHDTAQKHAVASVIKDIRDCCGSPSKLLSLWTKRSQSEKSAGLSDQVLGCIAYPKLMQRVYIAASNPADLMEASFLCEQMAALMPQNKDALQHAQTVIDKIHQRLESSESTVTDVLKALMSIYGEEITRETIVGHDSFEDTVLYNLMTNQILSLVSSGDITGAVTYLEEAESIRFERAVKTAQQLTHTESDALRQRMALYREQDSQGQGAANKLKEIEALGEKPVDFWVQYYQNHNDTTSSTSVEASVARAAAVSKIFSAISTEVNDGYISRALATLARLQSADAALDLTSQRHGLELAQHLQLGGMVARPLEGLFHLYAQSADEQSALRRISRGLQLLQIMAPSIVPSTIVHLGHLYAGGRFDAVRGSLHNSYKDMFKTGALVYMGAQVALNILPAIPLERFFRGQALQRANLRRDFMLQTGHRAMQAYHGLSILSRLYKDGLGAAYSPALVSSAASMMFSGASALVHSYLADRGRDIERPFVYRIEALVTGVNDAVGATLATARMTDGPGLTALLVGVTSVGYAIAQACSATPVQYALAAAMRNVNYHAKLAHHLDAVGDCNILLRVGQPTQTQTAQVNEGTLVIFAKENEQIKLYKQGASGPVSRVLAERQRAYFTDFNWTALSAAGLLVASKPTAMRLSTLSSFVLHPILNALAAPGSDYTNNATYRLKKDDITAAERAAVSSGQLVVLLQKGGLGRLYYSTDGATVAEDWVSLPSFFKVPEGRQYIDYSHGTHSITHQMSAMLAQHLADVYKQEGLAKMRELLNTTFKGLVHVDKDAEAVNMARQVLLLYAVQAASNVPTEVLRLTRVLENNGISREYGIPAYKVWQTLLYNRLITVLKYKPLSFHAAYQAAVQAIFNSAPTPWLEAYREEVQTALRELMTHALYSLTKLALEAQEPEQKIAYLNALLHHYDYVPYPLTLMSNALKVTAATIAMALNDQDLARVFMDSIDDGDIINEADPELSKSVLNVWQGLDMARASQIMRHLRRATNHFSNAELEALLRKLLQRGYGNAAAALVQDSPLQRYQSYLKAVALFDQGRDSNTAEILLLLLQQKHRTLDYWLLFYQIMVDLVAGSCYVNLRPREIRTLYCVMLVIIDNIQAYDVDMNVHHALCEMHAYIMAKLQDTGIIIDAWRDRFHRYMQYSYQNSMPAQLRLQLSALSLQTESGDCFLPAEVPGDNDCAFHVLGTTRQEAIQALRAGLQNPSQKHYLMTLLLDDLEIRDNAIYPRGVEYEETNMMYVAHYIQILSQPGRWIEFNQSFAGSSTPGQLDAIAYALNRNVSIYMIGEDRRLHCASSHMHDASFQTVHVLYTALGRATSHIGLCNHYVRLLPYHPIVVELPQTPQSAPRSAQRQAAHVQSNHVCFDTAQNTASVIFSRDGIVVEPAASADTYPPQRSEVHPSKRTPQPQQG